MKNLIKLLSLIVVLSLTFTACKQQKECKKECKKECCEAKEASNCGPEYDKPCCDKEKKECKPDCEKPCCDKKTDSKENESNNDTTQNDVVIGDFVL